MVSGVVLDEKLRFCQYNTLEQTENLVSVIVFPDPGDHKEQEVFCDQPRLQSECLIVSVVVMTTPLRRDAMAFDSILGTL
jgi:hypothetical protein